MKGIFNEPIKGFGVLSDYARKHAALRTGIGGEAKLVGTHEAIQEQVDIFEEATRDLAQATDKILRKHGKGIIGKQFASHRLAQIMISLVRPRVHDQPCSGLDRCQRSVDGAAHGDRHSCARSRATHAFVSSTTSGASTATTTRS